MSMESRETEEDESAIEEGTPLVAPGADEEKKEPVEHLKPLTGKLRHRDVTVYDVESKDGDSQEKGFTRPFMLWLHWEDEFGFHEHRVFRDDDAVRERDPINILRHFRCKGAYLDADPGPNLSDFADDPNGGLQACVRCPGCADCLSKRHISPGGCVDKFLRFVLGMEGCPSCRAAGQDGKRWRKKDCICKKLEKRFQQKACRAAGSLSKGMNIYAHNGGKFDHLFLLGWLREHRDTFSFEIASVQSRIQRLDVWPRFRKKKDGFWSFLDSVSLLPMSLGKIGKTFCPDRTQKGKMPEADESDERWDEYNRDDCIVLREGLLAFHRLIAQLGGEVGVTAPATAMKLFRRKYMGKQWIFRNAHFKNCDDRCKAFYSAEGCDRCSCEGRCHGCAHEWVRGGYYGGRTEMFQEWGPKGTTYFDINSSYPASMLGDMPVGKMIEVDCTKMSLRHALLLLKKMRKDHIGFVECDVEIPKTCQIPPLPHRDDNGKLTFKVGHFSGTWDYDELMLLDHPLVLGKILSIKKTVWYGKRPVFKEMVEKVFEYRNKKRPDYNQGLDFCAKLMLNSLYGKFGMREERTGLICIGPGDPWPEYGVPIDGDHETCDLWEVERIVEASYIIPQISAHITSLSRIRLFLGLITIVAAGGTPVYSDTDSTTCFFPEGSPVVDETGTFVGGPDMRIGGALGEWKREEPGILLDGDFILPKLYALRAHKPDCIDPDCDGCRFVWHVPGCKGEEDKTCPGCAATKIKAKGVPYLSQTLSTWKKIIPKDKGGRGEKVFFERLGQHKGMLNKRHGTPGITRTHKSVRTTYDKRVLRPDGTTIPIYSPKKLPLPDTAPKALTA